MKRLLAAIMILSFLAVAVCGCKGGESGGTKAGFRNRRRLKLSDRTRGSSWAMLPSGANQEQRAGVGREGQCVGRSKTIELVTYTGRLCWGQRCEENGEQDKVVAIIGAAQVASPLP